MGLDRQLDPIEKDERNAVLDAIDHAFREDLSQSPQSTIAKPDLVYEDYLVAVDEAWLEQGENLNGGKPWEQHRTTEAKTAATPERER